MGIYMQKHVKGQTQTLINLILVKYFIHYLILQLKLNEILSKNVANTWNTIMWNLISLKLKIQKSNTYLFNKKKNRTFHHCNISKYLHVTVNLPLFKTWEKHNTYSYNKNVEIGQFENTNGSLVFVLTTRDILYDWQLSYRIVWTFRDRAGSADSQLQNLCSQWKIELP